MPSRPRTVSRWVWYLHEAWWIIFRWPQDQRADGRRAIIRDTEHWWQVRARQNRSGDHA